ncbi:olfactory receptor class A-like protein 1 [Dunckerocampus dactyliophorus]|uniref:olfactory receptor class A-like protein 1 n=1 Tax=Dunckerocampus dactyliophorus TaxID=161453 RepID=UPI00240750A6|nr:olfactory receptor class A-like protein 1 [Dunckerocampus dactyliophorus]
MDLCVTIKGVSFLLQTGMGILGNIVVLLAYGHIIFTEPKLLPVDMILCHLALANLMLMLTRGVPQTITVFGHTNLFNDPGCKVIIFSYRISRALSVCITCMLSVFQAVTVAPAGSHLSRLKLSLHSLVLPTFAGLWLLNSAIYFQTFFHAKAPRNGTIPAFTINVGFCHVDFRNSLTYIIKGVLASGRDFSFVALMVASSVYMLLLLHRHSRQMKAIRRSQGSGAKTRAAKTVVTLVVLYVFFFGIDNVIWIYMLTETKVPPVVADMRVFFSSCYASLSPYFIISSNKKVKAKIICVAEQDQPASMDTQASHDK